MIHPTHVGLFSESSPRSLFYITHLCTERGIPANLVVVASIGTPWKTAASLESQSSCWLRGGMNRWKAIAMMGTKQRSFAPLVNASLEDLVPQDHSACW